MDLHINLLILVMWRAGHMAVFAGFPCAVEHQVCRVCDGQVGHVGLLSHVIDMDLDVDWFSLAEDDVVDVRRWPLDKGMELEVRLTVVVVTTELVKGNL